MNLIPVKYHNKNYPTGIFPQLIEVAGNIDSKQLNIEVPYSLHTEYSYMKRNFNSDLLKNLSELKNAHKNGIPQLWKNTNWSKEYAIFIKRLVGDSIPPEVIEIHPPFKDYCDSFDTFWERFIVFHKEITKSFPNTKILIENRCGTLYSGSTFLLSTCNDIVDMCKFLSTKKNELGIIIDYPQLFSAEKIKMDTIEIDRITTFNDDIKTYVNNVGAIHLWGKKKSSQTNRWCPHSGDLNTFFSGDNTKKTAFLESLKNTYNDNMERYFIPEVNSSEEDLHSIVNDLISAKINFSQVKPTEYLLAVDWTNGRPEFVLFNHNNNQIRRIDAVGIFSIYLGNKLFCIGNKDLQTHEYIGCPHNSEVHKSYSKCFVCSQQDLLKYCVRCNGKQCFAKAPEALNRCNQEHFVYLAYFPDNIVKVGVAHHRRKYTRLFEQGALCALIIASCSNGKSARNLENNIRTMGFKDKVTSKFKIQHLYKIDVQNAYKILMKSYDTILNKQIKSYDETIRFFPNPELVTQKSVLSILDNLSPQEKQQLSLWDYFDNSETYSMPIDILDDINGLTITILSFAGTIAVLEQNNKKRLFDFKKLIGREMYIIKH